MTVTLGYEPAEIEVILVRNAPFINPGLIRENDQTWTHPPRMKFGNGGGDWLAALSPDLKVATFAASAAEVNAAVKSSSVAIYDPTTGYVYGRGSVRVVDGVPA